MRRIFARIVALVAVGMLSVHVSCISSYSGMQGHSGLQMQADDLTSNPALPANNASAEGGTFRYAFNMHKSGGWIEHEFEIPLSELRTKKTAMYEFLTRASTFCDNHVFDFLELRTCTERVIRAMTTKALEEGIPVWSEIQTQKDAEDRGEITTGLAVDSTEMTPLAALTGIYAYVGCFQSRAWIPFICGAVATPWFIVEPLPRSRGGRWCQQFSLESTPGEQNSVSCGVGGRFSTSAIRVSDRECSAAVDGAGRLLGGRHRYALYELRNGSAESLPCIQKREDIAPMLEHLGMRKGIEIGVERGDFGKAHTEPVAVVRSVRVSRRVEAFEELRR